MLQAENSQNVTVTNVHEPKFRQDQSKNEGGIIPDSGSTIVIAKPKAKQTEVNAFENQVNGRVQADPTTFPKFTFASKETFDQAFFLS